MDFWMKQRLEGGVSNRRHNQGAVQLQCLEVASACGNVFEMRKLVAKV